jgi:hypothetical protein
MCRASHPNNQFPWYSPECFFVINVVAWNSNKHDFWFCCDQMTNYYGVGFWLYVECMFGSIVAQRVPICTQRSPLGLFMVSSGLLKLRPTKPIGLIYGVGVEQIEAMVPQLLCHFWKWSRRGDSLSPKWGPNRANMHTKRPTGLLYVVNVVQIGAMVSQLLGHFWKWSGTGDYFQKLRQSYVSHYFKTI